MCELEELKNIVEVLAYISAAGFFGFKWVSGYLTTNLSIEIVSNRKQATPDVDFLGITIILSKGDRGSLHVFDVGVKIDWEVVDVRDQIEPYSVVRDKETREKRRQINWDSKDKRYHPFLQPGERTQIVVNREVSGKKVSRVEVVVVGRRKLSHRVKQWRASAVCLPV